MGHLALVSDRNRVAAISGGGVGLLLAFAGIELLRMYGPTNLPRLEEVGVEFSTGLLCFGLSLLAALFLVGVSTLSRRLSDLAGSLKDLCRGSTAGLRSTGKKVLVGAQVALALLLLPGATLMLQSLVQLRQVDSGFQPDNRLTFRLSLPVARYPDRAAAARFHRELLDEFLGIPGVVSVGSSRCLPLGGWCGGDPLIPEGTLESRITTPVGVKGVNPDYFEALGIRLLAGRSLAWADQEQETGVAVISRTLARHYWPEQDPLGKRFQIGTGQREEPWGTVVGVVEDILLSGLRGNPGEVPYFPLINKPGLRNLSIHDMTYVVRTSGDPMQSLSALKSRLHALNPELPMSDIRSLARHLDEATAAAAFATLLLIISALAANLMGALGLYAAMTYLVTKRTNEIGVRDVRWMILREAGKVMVVGTMVGLLISLGSIKFLSALLFGVSPNDPLSYFSVVLLVSLIGIAAAAFPARRAARLEPARALRWE